MKYRTISITGMALAVFLFTNAPASLPAFKVVQVDLDKHSLHGVDRGGITRGRLTDRTGSAIFVNGIEIDIANAAIAVDGSPADAGALRLGHILSVTGDFATSSTVGVAVSVDLQPDVEGPVSSVDVESGTVVVLGQTAIVDADTQLGSGIDPGLASLNEGDVIALSGYRSSTGDLNTTRIESAPDITRRQVLGTIEGVDRGGLTIQIGDLIVSYSSASLDGFAATGPVVGDRAAAVGTGLDAQGHLVATSLSRLQLGDPGGPNAFLRLEGLVTAIGSETAFSVDGVSVATTAATEFQDGTAADLRLDSRVEVAGLLGADEVLIAEEVEFDNPGAVYLIAPVQAIRPQVLFVLGVPVVVDGATVVADDSAAGVDEFSLAELSAGEFVEVRCIKTPSNALPCKASSVTRVDARSAVSIEGTVRSINEAASFVNVAGIVIWSDPQIPETGEFFDLVRVGSRIVADGRAVAIKVVAASRLELD